MSGDRSDLALARIEAALARIEAAARKPRSTDNDGELARVSARHQRLRAEVTDALGQLDTILEGPRG